jgi:hypothetical protein
LVPAELGTVPPSATERLKQRGGIGITVGLGLNPFWHLVIKAARVDSRTSELTDDRFQRPQK